MKYVDFCVTSSPGLPEFIIKMLICKFISLSSFTESHVILMSMYHGPNFKKVLFSFWHCKAVCVSVFVSAHKQITLSCLQNCFISLESLSELWRTSLFNKAQGLMNPLCIIIGPLYKRSFVYPRLSPTMSQINHQPRKKKISRMFSKTFSECK